MKKLLLFMIRLYQRFISPLKPPRYRCRYYPTCSSYFVKAIERFGVVRGLMLGARRVLSCHPWSSGGVDLVPVTWRQGKKIFKKKGGVPFFYNSREDR